MRNNSADDLRMQVKRLERQVRVLFITLVVGSGLALTSGILRRIPSSSSASVLRVRGLIVEDANGRARILIGAPVPKTRDRKRTDDPIGMVVLGENGADRVAIGAPTPAPQADGKLYPRIAPSAGIAFDDQDGNERGGFGYLDNGTVSLGLDYSAGREAVTLSVLPSAGFAGLIVNAPQDSVAERAEIGVLKDGTSLIKLADTKGTERLMAVVQGQNAAQVLGITPLLDSSEDIRVSWLNPDASTHLLFRPGQNFWRELSNLKPPAK